MEKKKHNEERMKLFYHNMINNNLTKVTVKEKL